jgi:hypothetical protein
VRLKNYTDLPDNTIREIIRAVKPSGVSNFDISIKNCASTFRGRAYYTGCAYHDTASPLVIASIGKADKFPLSAAVPGGYLPVILYTRLEALVFVVAHELRHLWQAKHPRGWRVWGARGQFSERDADAYAIKSLRSWRKRITL